VAPGSTLSVVGIDDSFGPYRALARDQALLLWAASNDDGSRAWYSVLTNAQGQPRAHPLRLTAAPSEVGPVRVRATATGFLALIGSKGTEGPTLESLALGDGGQLQSGTLITQPAGDVLWLDVFPMTDRALIAWAALSGTGRADVFAATLSLQGALTSQPQLVAKGVSAWQALALNDEVAIATVMPVASDSAGKVELSFVSQAGAASPKIELSKSPSAQPDIDLARVGDKLICAWSELDQHRARIRASVVDAQGKVVVAAKSLSSGVRDQALVRLVSRPNATHAYLMWEDLSPNIGTPRQFSVSRIDTTATRVGRTLAVRYDAEGGVPEIEASDNGAVILSQLSTCTEQPCADEDSAVAPHYARLGSDLSLLGSSQIEVPTTETASPGREIPDAVWAMDCAQQCSALATLKQSPARIFTVTLSDKALSDKTQTNEQHRLVTAVDTTTRPRVTDIAVLAETEPLAKVTAVTTARGPLLAWLTDFDPNTPEAAPRLAPDGQKRPAQAWLQTRLLTADDAAATVETISYRARSAAGMSLTHDPKTQNTLLVWAALDQNKPHVFVTLLDAQGKKLKQRMLTQTPGEVYDTAAVAVEDGFVVAWVDARSGEPRAYATKIDAQLARRMPDTPLGSGAVSGLALESSDNQLWLAYAESSESLANESIYAVRVAIQDLRLVGVPTRLSSGRRHAYSPELAHSKAGVQALWLEDESQELDALAHVLTSRIEAGVVSGSSELDLLGFSASSATVSCQENGACRIAVTGRDGSQRAVLLGGMLGGRSAGLQILAELDATGLLAAPALLDSAIFLGDMGREGHGWVERIQVEW
jgi:hypothetical protein